MRKVLDVIVIIIFIIFAFVQWNDPDPTIWIITYLLVAAVAGQSLIGHFYKWPSYIFFSVLIMATLTYIPDIINWFGDGMPSITNSMKAESPYIELVREFFGLLISVFVVGWYVLKLEK